MSSSNNDDRSYYTTGEVARFCEVTIPTVKNWIKKGLLRTTKTPGGINRIRKEDFLEFVHTVQVPVTDFPLNSRRVLVISSDADLCTFVAGILADRDFQVSATRDAYEACLLAGSAAPDLVLVDIEHAAFDTLMARFFGFEGLRQTRVVVMHDEVDPVQPVARKWPIVGTVVKPISKDELVPQVERLIVATSRVSVVN